MITIRHLLCVSFLSTCVTFSAVDTSTHHENKTNIQHILEKPYRHITTVGISGVALGYGIRGLAKTPGLLKTPFAMLLVASGLVALYKTEQATNKSTIKTIAQPMYETIIAQHRHIEDMIDIGYESAVKKIDNATIFVQEVIKEYAKKKN